MSVKVQMKDGSLLSIGISYKNGDVSDPSTRPMALITMSCDETSMSRDEFKQIYLDIVKHIKPDMEVTYVGPHKLKEDWDTFDTKLISTQQKEHICMTETRISHTLVCGECQITRKYATKKPASKFWRDFLLIKFFQFSTLFFNIISKTTNKKEV